MTTTTIVCALVGADQNMLESIETAYAKLASVPAVWVDVESDLLRPVMRRKGHDRASWYDKTLPDCLRRLSANAGDIDLFVTARSEAEAQAVRESGGIVAHLGASDAEVDADDLDLHGVHAMKAARRLAEMLA